MSEYTPNLNLFKYNTSTDGKEVFSIEQALNANWDIIDNLDPLPDQTGKSGYLLTTNGSTASWGQTGEINPVVETYMDESTGSWYRVYSDGWCEQGGVVVTPTIGYVDVVFLKEFSSILYFPFVNAFQTDGAYTNWYAGTSFKTSGGMRVAGQNTGYSYTIGWMACGYIEV